MEGNKMMPTSEAISRRTTGIWRLRGTDQDQNVEKESLAVKQSTSASDPALNYDHVDGSFEFGGIRVRLVTYKSIPGVIQINAPKTISEWNTLRTLKHINIVGFDNSNPSISHWLLTNADDHEDDPKGRCELYISKPPLSVTVAAAAAQYPWSVLDAHRMCKNILNALKFLADHNLSRGDFTTEHSLERHQRTTKKSASSLPPVNITNVLPALTGQAYHLATSARIPAPDMPSKYTPIDHLDIPGFLDDQVEEYCAFLQSRVRDPNKKIQYQKACDVILEEDMDLELIRRNPNTKFLTDKGIKRAPAKHVVGNIDYWVGVKRARTEE